MTKVFVTKSSMPPLEEYIDEIKSMWDNHWLTNMGEKHEKFRELLVKYLDIPYIELLVNGHMALEMTLQAMNLTGEVITTPFTFASTTHAITRNGLTPVFCDISLEDYTMDVSKIEKLITEKTCAILPVHVYGTVCNVEEIERIAKKHNIKVIYDAAHAFGVQYKGRGIGNFGDASIFSFHATKVFHSIEGGAVAFQKESFGLDLYRLKNFGIRGPEQVDFVGANAKMNEFQAAMGLCNLRHFEEELERRKIVYEQYFKELETVTNIKLPQHRVEQSLNYSYFPVLVLEEYCNISRDLLFSKLEEQGIGARKYFYPLTNTFACYKDQFDIKDTPNAMYVSERVITLPLYADLSLEDVSRICSVIREVLK